jgi:hypothetical protein
MFPHIFSRWGNIGALLWETLGIIGVFCFPATYREFPHITAALSHFQGLRALFQTSKITSLSDLAGIGDGWGATLIYKGWGELGEFDGETLAWVSPFLFIVSVMDVILY